MKYTVWWFEKNSFNGKVTRHNVDFKELHLANRFLANKEFDGIKKVQLDLIKDCPWHHSHAAYLSVMQNSMIKGKK